MPCRTQAVAVELIRLLYQQILAVLAANLVNGSLVVVALWYSADRQVLVGWGTGIVLLSVGRLALWRGFLRSPAATTANEDAARWARYFSLGSMVSGLLWGSAALLFIRPGDPQSLILMAFVIGGMAAGSVTSLSAYPLAFHLYLLCSVLPLELRLLTLGDRVSFVIAGMVLAFIAGLLLIGRNFTAVLLRELELNKENQRLLATREGEVYSRTADLLASKSALEIEVAERRNAETGLREARAEAERANQAKSRFLAAASHDLRQPLQAMFLFASALHRHIADKRGVEALVRIERGLDLLKGMLDSLLDISRLDVNVIHPQMSVFPIQPMLEDIVASYRRVAGSKGVDLNCGPPVDGLIYSDQCLLGRMIRNLVENAIRYTEQGHIVLSCTLSGDSARVEVGDTGIGIAPDQLGRIFEEFHQVGNPERDKARGLGLGLAIVQRLSTILDHSVEVRSDLGNGSTFSIRVPVAAAAAAHPVPSSNGPALVNNGTGRQVVLIDDDPMVLLALGSVFEGWGYQVTMAGSKDEALERLQSSPRTPHLIVSDYRLRNGMVGTDAIKGIRASCGAVVPSIILTGETGNECVVDAEETGSMILHKPVTPHQLSFVLKRLLGEEKAV
jgi:signal transduction histidine kinase/ActR/RegA family two-component response regulator